MVDHCDECRRIHSDCSCPDNPKGMYAEIEWFRSGLKKIKARWPEHPAGYLAEALVVNADRRNFMEW